MHDNKILISIVYTWDIPGIYRLSEYTWYRHGISSSIPTIYLVGIPDAVQVAINSESARGKSGVVQGRMTFAPSWFRQFQCRKQGIYLQNNCNNLNHLNYSKQNKRSISLPGFFRVWCRVIAAKETWTLISVMVNHRTVLDGSGWAKITMLEDIAWVPRWACWFTNLRYSQNKKLLAIIVLVIVIIAMIKFVN